MEIKVKLFASYRFKRFKEEYCQYPEGTTVEEVMQQLGIAISSLGVILLNGQPAEYAATLHDGDVLSLIPFVGGG